MIPETNPLLSATSEPEEQEQSESDFQHDPLIDLVGVNLADMDPATLDRLLAHTRSVRMSAHSLKSHLKEASVKIAKKVKPSSGKAKLNATIDMFS